MANIEFEMDELRLDTSKVEVPESKIKLPKKLGELVDLGRELQQKRLARQREMVVELATLKADEKRVNAAVQERLEDGKMEKATGSIAAASLNVNAIPRVNDWDKFYAHILKTKSFDLLEKRPAKGAYRERLDAGDKVPGVETFWAKTITYSKFNGKA